MTRDCIDWLFAQTYGRLEIVLVDNGSEELEREHLAEDFSDALLLPRNLGFAGGVNWGVSQATGEFIALVNNDAVLRPNCIEQLVQRLQANPTAGAVSGRLVNVDSMEYAIAISEMDDETLATLGESGPIVDAWRESGENHGLSLYGFVVPRLYGERGESFYPSGGLCLLRRSAINAILPRLFPQLYFAYHEDVWLGFKLRSQGWDVVKEPSGIAAHVQGATSRRVLGTTRLRFLQERNRWLNILGWYPLSVIIRLFPLLALQAFLMCGLSLLTSPARYLGTMGAHLWLLLHPLAVLRHRRRSRAGSTAPAREWLCELSGKVRGRAGVANQLSLLWCKALRIPCREDSKLTRNG
jgi:GT2 family glycosyltransferase